MLWREGDPFLRRAAGGGCGAGVIARRRWCCGARAIIGRADRLYGELPWAVGAARPGAARVRVVMSSVLSSTVMMMVCRECQHWQWRPYGGVGVGWEGVWRREEKAENGVCKGYLLTEPPWPSVFCFGSTPYSVGWTLVVRWWKSG